MVAVTVPESATTQYWRQQEIAIATVALLRRQWVRIGDDFDAGYAAVRSQMIRTLQLGRAATVHAAMPYMSAVLAETGQRGTPAGAIIPAAFLESEPNGMRVGTTFDAIPAVAKRAVEQGLSTAEALARTGRWTNGVGLTMLADTRRDVYQADMVARPRVTGWVRMLNPPSCSRCTILAGKRFLWNQGFQRHPRCDCIHIPASEQVANDITTDPYAYFRSLSREQQDRVFGAVEAQAIRDGGDIYRVVNFGRSGLGTAAGNARFGTPYKRTLEDIYRRDPSRQFVVANMQHHGWITGPQTPGGNILGNDPARRILDAGRGRGTYTVGGQTVTTARAARFDAAMSGTRDPLNRATMTAAERALYDAHYRASWARAGYSPNSIGANSADRGLGLKPVTASESAAAEERLRVELGRLTDQPSSVHELARLLGY